MATTNHLFQRAIKFHLAGDFLSAKPLYLKLLEKVPNHVDSIHLLGLLEFQSGNPVEAEPLILKAIALNPNVAPFYNNLGTVQSALNKIDAALTSYKKSVQLDPKYGDGWRNVGNLCSRLNQHEEAAQAFSTLVNLSQGKDGENLGFLGLSLAVLCDWDNLALAEGAVKSQLSQLTTPIPPFCSLIYDLTPEIQRNIADFSAQTYKHAALKATGGKIYPPKTLAPDRPGKLKIGYLSDDFQAHAVGYLVVGLLEAHDHERFDISLYSYGPPISSPIRDRIAASADHFVDISSLTWQNSAQKIFDDGIDILIDLKGHTGTPRAQILGLHPAPIQVAWLGYPGTFGGSDIEFIMADSVVIPTEEEVHYSEKVIRLPHSYQANDPKRPRAAKAPSAESVGLPPKQFVWGALNNTFKITAPLFGAWMRILSQCPKSVLWLLDHHPTATAHLKNAAIKAGVDPERLIFAPRASQEEHMTRLSCCSLALDTYPYGGHTTTSDFLWAGVPVITQTGRTFASRVAASLLTTIGAPELITHSLEEYETLAVSLYNDAKKLKALTTKIQKGRTASPLFDSKSFARHFEQALDEIYRLKSKA